MRLLDKKLPYLVILGILILYFLTHIFRLTYMPVFADEAIYIRWSQLILDDWQRYLFFPLNDGKTPLYIWLQIPFLKIFQDPLFAGRFLAVLIGAVQFIVIKRIIERLEGKNLSQLIGMISVMVLPFWVFYHRMALIDGLLTLFLSTTILGLIELSRQSVVTTKKSTNYFLSKRVIFWIFFTGVNYGFAILTKLPAIFFLPVFPIFSQLFSKRWTFFSNQVWKNLICMGIASFIGLTMFAALKIHPAFGQLFSRGQDFTFTVSELIGGQWRASINNIGKVIFWEGSYISFTFVALTFLSIFFSKQRRLHLIFLVSMFIFVTPFIVFGRVLSPRYVLPMILFSTVSISLFLEELYSELKTFRWVIIAICVPAVFIVIRFFWSLWFNFNTLALVPIDREQYIEEWSAGQGNREMAEIITEKAKTGRVVVATEGYFGTLPDGLLMYFHNRNVENIEIFGVGQPIYKIPDEWYQKAQTAETAYLLVNTYRMFVVDPCLTLAYKFPRPGESSSLDVYELQKGCLPDNSVLELSTDNE